MKVDGIEVLKLAFSSFGVGVIVGFYTGFVASMYLIEYKDKVERNKVYYEPMTRPENNNLSEP
jgi:hypothetical protein